MRHLSLYFVLFAVAAAQTAEDSSSGRGCRSKTNTTLVLAFQVDGFADSNLDSSFSTWFAAGYTQQQILAQLAQAEEYFYTRMGADFRGLLPQAALGNLVVNSDVGFIAPVKFIAPYYLTAQRGLKRVLPEYDEDDCPQILSISHWVLFVQNLNFRYNGTYISQLPVRKTAPQAGDFWVFGFQRLQYSQHPLRIIDVFYQTPVPGRLDADGRVSERVNIQHPLLGNGSAVIDVNFIDPAGFTSVRATWTFPGSYGPL
jgi:hypothetical protein